MLTGNKLNLFFCTSLIILLSSCRQQYDKSLVHIDSLSDTNADSAQSLLTAFDTTAVPTSDLMYYRLLQIKVNDKLDSLKYSNEEAEQFVANFEEKGNEQLLPTAYYYGGRICAENKNAPQALNYFRKAETLLKEHDDNPALLSKVYSQMGYLFVERRMYDEARNCSQKSYKLDKSINDTIGMIYNLRDIGISYKWADEEKKSIPFFRQARQLATESHNSFLQNSVDMQLSSVFIDIQEIDSARKYGLPLLYERDIIDTIATIFTVSDIYYHSHQTDSAEFLFKKLIMMGEIEASSYAHQKLAEIYMSGNRKSDALKHYQQYQDLKYISDKKNSTKEIAQANSAYNYEQKEKENHLLKFENKRQNFITSFFASSFTFIVIISVFYFYYNRQKQQKKVKELERINNDICIHSKESIDKGHQRIVDLEMELKNASIVNKELCKQLNYEKKQLEATLEMSILREREAKQSYYIIRNSNIYCRILQLANTGKPQLISNEDWLELETIINREFNGFTSRLQELCRMSEFEYRVCLLLKVGTDIQTIAKILMRALSTISSTRIRLYEKAFAKKGSAKEWDMVIKSL